MRMENFGLGMDDPAQDEFEESQDICNRWEDSREDRDYENLIQ